MKGLQKDASEADGKAGRVVLWRPLIGLLEPDLIAVIAVHAAILATTAKCGTDAQTSVSAAAAIAEDMRTQIEFEMCQAEQAAVDADAQARRDTAAC